MANLILTQTHAFEAFNKSFNDSVYLAQASAIGGEKLAVEFFQQFYPVITFDKISELARSDEFKSRISKISDLEQQQKFLKDGDGLGRFGNRTIPQLLLTFLITIFEAYIDDIILSIFTLKPEIALTMTPELQANETLREEQLRKQAIKRTRYITWPKIFEDTFQNELNIPVIPILQRAGTTSQELDKAKAIRNLYIHNKGFVNSAFINRVGNTTLHIDQEYPLDIDYLLDLKDKIYFSALGLDLAIVMIYNGIQIINISVDD